VWRAIAAQESWFMADSAAEIAFEQTMRGVDGQTQDLGDIRSHLNIILTGGGIAATFLGVKPDGPHGWPFWLAVGAFAVVGAIAIIVYWPVRWFYDFDGDDLIAEYVDVDPPWTQEDTFRELALHATESYADNRTVLDRLYWYQGAALVFFGIEIIGLLLNIGRS